MPKEPKNLNIKIGTKDEALWTNVLNAAKSALQQAEESVKVQKEVLLMARRKLEQEKRKQKV